MQIDEPSLEDIRQARLAIDDVIVTTPAFEWRSERIEQMIGRETRLFPKLELLQVGGSFKTRGATLSIRALSDEQRRRGVVTASGGNHAIAIALAARAAGTTAHVYMGRQANPFRQQRCRALGANVHL